MAKIPVLAVCSVVFSLFACSKQAPDMTGEAKKTIDQDQTEHTSKPGGAIPQHQLHTLQKAKSVEKLLLDADKERREQIP